ncbi:MAG: ADP-glyceromanno-heptose 6-epimerase [Gammaproteobacteria bacterium]|nr:ADP-glyceromanno-heptose 6-epimerase [Gammaproteobacteria bacterium]
MIVITGAAGFIGSNLIRRLNIEGFYDIVLVDKFLPDKERNWKTKTYIENVDRDHFIDWVDEYHRLIRFVYHIGARTDTIESDKSVFEKLNLNYSKQVWEKCTEYNLPLVYISSAATYGDGALGYEDSHDLVHQLKPLNLYGESKNEFDKWVLQQEKKPNHWIGLKIFNVYGPNEYHKKQMASVVFHAFNQIKETGKVKLFRSHRLDFEDGEQSRDFVYVKDVVDVLYFFLHYRKNSGIYNLGTGQAKSFLDLVRNIFKALNMKENIEFIDTPENIRDKYQYFTQAAMQKLFSIGYAGQFQRLDQGVMDYVSNYLIKNRYE